MPGTPVHPRACGEHGSALQFRLGSHGSSPRVRGTHWLHGRRRSEFRFIPARAGNTRCAASARCHSAGSSPRVRGTHIERRAALFYGRFIPARAGNTRVRPATGRARPVHPRACGEHASLIALKSCSCGSSPRVRGTRASGDSGLAEGRFIPARAGNTFKVVHATAQ